jgi:hypothetical protein
MTNVPETTTEKPFSAADYTKATVIGAARPINTTFAMTTARTVTTTATKGIVTLRYTPRDQPRLSGKTS